MQIIESGYTIKKCSRCECVMYYDKDDIKTERCYIYKKRIFLPHREVYDKEYIECPQCGNKIIIAATKIQPEEDN